MPGGKSVESESQDFEIIGLCACLLLVNKVDSKGNSRKGNLMVTAKHSTNKFVKFSCKWAHSLQRCVSSHRSESALKH